MGYMHPFYVWGVDFEECCALVYNNCVKVDLIYFFNLLPLMLCPFLIYYDVPVPANSR